jgi:hypothetical protein
MFIAHVGGKNSPALEERNVLAGKLNISLRWSFGHICYFGSVNIWSLRTRSINDVNQQINLKELRVIRLVLIGRT